MNKFLSLICLTLLTFNINAASLYGGASYTYGVSTANSDYWNGASGSAPLLLFGIRFERLALELQFRPYTLNNLHTSSFGTYDIDIKDNIFGLGMRFNGSQSVHYNLGLVLHDINVEYESSSSTTLSSKSIAGATMSFYVGGGLHGPLFISGLEWLVDMNYIHHSIEYGVFSFDFGVTYSFLSF
ncbi:hypothetical protein [Halobacteriovorax sp. HLS]|uniref:hypothetical protein n=1 Tax=Halobacteriovorax sp. HLS TaxID=2234000 RepID=UPI000FDBFBBB|nr:hypothetical protein [Halobacteriovorax sp. HLS]